jgi:hypothetical protein
MDRCTCVSEGCPRARQQQHGDERLVVRLLYTAHSHLGSGEGVDWGQIG